MKLFVIFIVCASATNLRPSEQAAPSCTPAEACEPSDATRTPWNISSIAMRAYERSMAIASHHTPSPASDIPHNSNSTGRPAVFEQEFVAGNVAQIQCDTFANNYLPSLEPGQYKKVTFEGDHSEVVGTNKLECEDALLVNSLAEALKNNMAFAATCTDPRGFDHLWSLCPRHDHAYQSPELWIDAPDLCSVHNCPNPGWVLRPCIQNFNWGGAGTATCNWKRISLTFE